MFYSQFILAKKGPLGTIWIAAHLERKLRKNQVADTDIGTSVDSILSPDVPIALRMSSHLLLGVVRIYSRKVNYLFDDCSETLLNVKQAFRSAAVDLPPEESKAPYNSITLPETFDLDDFELPDNENIQGNFVDHHISSKDQITLQDSMNGVAYSTSQFGLDERFGDGDASGLDLDEELFMEKIETAGHAIERSDPQSSVGPMTPLKQDEYPETMEDGGDDDADAMDYEHAPCTPGLVEEPNLSNEKEVLASDDHLESEYHVGGSSVIENVKNDIFGDKQDVNWPFCDNTTSEATPTDISKPQGDSPVGPNIEHVQLESSSGFQTHPDLLDQDKTLNPASDVSCLRDLNEALPQNDNTSLTYGNSEVLPQNDNTSLTYGNSDVSCLRDLNEALPQNDNTSLTYDNPSDHHQGHNETGLEKSYFEISGVTTPCHQVSEDFSRKDEVIASDLEKPLLDALDLPSKSQDGSFLQNPEAQAYHGNANPSSINRNELEKVASFEAFLLRQCNSNMVPPGVTSGNIMSTNAALQSDVTTFAASEREETVMIGKDCSRTDYFEEMSRNHMQEHSLREGIYAPDNQVTHSSAHEKLMGNLNNSSEAYFPAPENLLSVAEDRAYPHNRMLPGASPGMLPGASPGMLPGASPGVFTGIDEGYAGSKIASGKKRSFTESTLTEQSLYSVESSRLLSFKRTPESVPNDDDLLSSILAGRSSVLKVKPTPRRSEATSTKRTRSGPRTGALKRKIPMDDTMVLHGDMIRQQLTSTQDIRRVRKKAPCTLAEISMIRKQHLNDDNFLLQPLFTGMSIELISLHNQNCDLRGITVFKNDLTGISPEIDADLRQPSENLRSNDDSSFETMAEPIAIPYDVQDGTLRSSNDASFETMAEPISIPNDVQDGSTLRSSNEARLTSQSFENVENLDAGSDKNSEKPNVVEQSEMRITDPLLLDRDSEMAKSNESPLLFNNRMNEVDQTNIDINTFEEHTTRESSLLFNNRMNEVDQTNIDINTFEGHTKRNSDAEDDRTELERLLDANGVETSDKNNDASGPSTTVVQITEANETNTCAYSDTLFCLPDQEKNAPSIELDHSVMGVDISRDEGTAKDGDINAVSETEALARDEAVSERDSFDLLSNSKAAELGYDERIAIHSDIFGENVLGPAYAPGLQGDGFMENGANPGQGEEEAYQRFMMGADGSYFDLNGQEVQEEQEYTAAGNDTEFLNVDDDELNDMADDDHDPDDEDARFADNTGWSSRTRAVSKYLQTMFVKETESGRNSLNLDSLLKGKSRKEASRMFFETLVLKTRDYIHVEQPKPFDNITIKPRTRLMKSNF